MQRSVRAVHADPGRAPRGLPGGVEQHDIVQGAVSRADMTGTLTRPRNSAALSIGEKVDHA